MEGLAQVQGRSSLAWPSGGSPRLKKDKIRSSVVLGEEEEGELFAFGFAKIKEKIVFFSGHLRLELFVEK